MNRPDVAATPRPRPRAARRGVAGGAVLLAAAMAFGGAGCVAAGWLADGVTPASRTVKVEAEYLGLEDQRVAVLVDADLEVAFSQPLAQLEVATAISNRIAENVPGATVLDPREVIQFQQSNLYWNTSPYSQLMERLEVDRLVVVELVDYRLHEPGNVNVWRGRMSGNLAVAEVDAERANDPVYESTVSVQYPPDREVGMLNAEERTIRLATLELFSLAAAGKFYDHQRTRER